LIDRVHSLEHDGRWMAGGYFFFRRGIFDELTDDSMLEGMALYFTLAHKHGLITTNKPLAFAN